ncbi:hypothetical protein [Bermanella sp. R86510]|uniref:hypothetical protein n=1 Tax=unclassified Bermanella TaxID=2627862 RepID=UPI0037C64477
MKLLLPLLAISCVAGYFLLDDSIVEQSSSATAEEQTEFLPQTQQEKWKADTALFLYQTIEKYNFEYAAKHYVTDPEALLQLTEGWSLEAESYRVKEVNDQGLVMGFTRFCYPEVDVQVYMVQKGQRYYVEFGRTFREQVRSNSNPKPLRQFCHEFKDQPLQGMVMSGAWAADRAETQVMNTSSGKRLQVDVVTKKCDQYPDCRYFDEQDADGSGFVVGVSALDFSGRGGNLGGNQYITVSSPDYPTINRHDGSYRISKLSNGKTRLELSIPEFESTSLNGYIDLDLPTIDE